jgi:TetR/AcrR family transcriptional regulator, transcriptional repressor for nem operon
MMDIIYVKGAIGAEVMKVSREQMRINRERIMTEAARLFREKGFDGVSVAEVMNAAGLTHGGFYGHFASKDDLIAQTVAHMMANGAKLSAENLSAFVNSYLSRRHRDAVAQGCPIAALAGDIRRQDADARRAMTAGLRAQIDRIAVSFADDESKRTQQRAAVGVWATMVGALVLARTTDDAALSDQILRDAKAWLSERIPIAAEG